MRMFLFVFEIQLVFNNQYPFQINHTSAHQYSWIAVPIFAKIKENNDKDKILIIMSSEREKCLLPMQILIALSDKRNMSWVYDENV